MEQAAQQAAEHVASGNWVDIAVLIIVLISAIFAFIRGFVREALSLACWAGALAATLVFYPMLQPHMREQIEQKAVADGATALVLFCGALIVLIPITYLLGNMVKGKALTAIDRSLGFVFGLVRGMLVVCLIYLFMSWIWPAPNPSAPAKEDTRPEWLMRARTQPMMEKGAEIIQGFIPKDQKNQALEAKRKAEKINEQLKANDELLQNLSVPKPTAQQEEQPAYQPEQSNKIDKLIDMNSAP